MCMIAHCSPSMYCTAPRATQCDAELEDVLSYYRTYLTHTCLTPACLTCALLVRDLCLDCLCQPVPDRCFLWCSSCRLLQWDASMRSSPGPSVRSHETYDMQCTRQTGTRSGLGCWGGHDSVPQYSMLMWAQCSCAITVRPTQVDAASTGAAPKNWVIQKHL